MASFRRATTIALSFALISVAFATSAHAQNTVQITTEVVAPGVYMLSGAGGNIGLAIGDDAVFMVDDQVKPVTPMISAAVVKLTQKPVRFVFNTHWHDDHTGGNEKLGEGGALIVAHDNVRRRMSTEQFIEFMNTRIPASPKAALPVVTFSDTVSFHINNDHVLAFHVDPAHTDGDAIVVWKNANVVHMGDTFFSSGYPFIDLSSGGNVNGVIAAADRVLAITNANSRIIPGHGPLTDRARLQQYRDMLAAVRDLVQREVAAGRTLQQVIAAKPTAQFDAEWGKSFIKPEQFVELVYKSLNRAASRASRQ